MKMFSYIKKFSKRQKIFIFIAFLMLLITIFIISFFITELGLKISQTLDMPEKSKIEKIEFDIEGAKNLNLIK